MPAGEIATHPLPGQGAREQSAGATLAGRAPTTTVGGGGGFRLLSGGEGGRASLRDPCVTHVPYPAAGEGPCTCERRWRDGGRAGGTTCPGTCGAPAPLASSRLSPATGDGPTVCARSGVGGWWGQGKCMVYSPASRFPYVRSARVALRTPVAGSGDLVAGGSARGPAGVASSARVVCPTGRGRSTAWRPAAGVAAAGSGPRGGGGGGGVLPVCPGTGRARAWRADPNGPAQAMRRGWRGGG